MTDDVAMPPRNDDAEKSLLGALLMDNNQIGTVRTIITADMFYKEENAAIYKTVIDFYANDIEADVVSVCDALQETAQPLYIAELGDAVSTPKLAPTYAKMVLDKYILRRLMQAGSVISKSVHESDRADTILNAAVRGVGDVAHEMLSANRYYKPPESTAAQGGALAGKLEKMYKDGGGLPGHPTGWKKLDTVLHGWREEKLIVVAGRPGQGKTCFGVQAADFITIDEYKPLFVSLEMSAQEIMSRIVSMRCDIVGDKMNNGKFDDYEWAAVTKSIGNIIESGWRILDRPGSTLREIEASIKAEFIDSHYDMIVLDYLQLMRGDFRQKRHEMLGDATRLFKQMARELNTTFVCISQLNRGMEDAKSKKPRRPRLSDLKESGAIEQDADSVLLIYRPGAFTKDVDERETELIVAKNRAGATEIIRMTFEPEYTRFKEARDGHYESETGRDRKDWN